MNNRPATRVPGYCRHKASGQARTTINGKDHYLGTYGSVESKEAYRRLIAEHLGRPPGALADELLDGVHAGAEVSVEELVAAYFEEAQVRYRGSKELLAIKIVMGHLRRMFADLPADKFGPLKLRQLQRSLIDSGLARKTINQHVKRAVRIVKWGAGQELVPASVWHGLLAVESVKEREAKTPTKKVAPVPMLHVEAVLPHVSRQVAAAIRLQLLTGARPGEILAMRPGDVERDGPHGCWTYKPQHHKTEHHGLARIIFLGPKGQAVLEPFLDREPGTCCFSPDEAERERNDAKIAARRVKLHRSYDPTKRRKAKPERQPQDRYTVDSYRRAIERACDKAKVARWTPHQLRHSAATELRREFGVETAQVTLGHKNVNVTEVYAEKNMDAVARAIAKVG